MAAIFSHLFSCCIRRRSRDTLVVIDEEARLIPPTEPLPQVPNVVVVDHQKLKDRLGTIVRAKEGKMVNVTSQVPFNLYNQNLANGTDPSSSRSASLSNPNRYGFPPNHQRPTNLPGLSVTPVHSSPSRGPSISRSSSTSSVRFIDDLNHSRRGSLAPSDGTDSEPYAPPPPRNPILNVRLVSGYGSVGHSPSRRGRTRYKAGTTNSARNSSGLAVFTSNDDGEHEAAGSDGRDASEEAQEVVAGDEDDQPHDVATQHALGLGINTGSEGSHEWTNYPEQHSPTHPQETDPGSPSSPSEPTPRISAPPFKIRDTGAIALSWGD